MFSLGRPRETIDFTLRCPKCDYSLPGSRTAFVKCPECGTDCNLASIANRPRGGLALRGRHMMRDHVQY